MADQSDSAGTKPRSTAHKWIDAVLDTWEHGGHAAVSARSLSLATGMPNSSIFHHFGSLERLYLSAQEAAQAAAALWCKQRLQELADTPRDIEALPAIMAALIDDWCERERRLALAWRECQLLATRDHKFAEPAAAWRKLWEGFWQTLCDRLGSGTTAPLTALIFDGESFFHMLRWRRPFDRAALDELCRGWSAWLKGKLVPPSHWRDVARVLAAESLDQSELRDETAGQIAAAAAKVLGDNGVAGVTHRAVATAAGHTLGVVSHKFRTSADLLSAAFETVYWHGISSADIGHRRASPEVDTAALIDRFVTWPASDGSRLARTELMMAAMRDPSLSRFAAQLRYMRGRSSGTFLHALLGGERAISPLDAAIFASFVNGQRNAHAGLGEEERRKRSVAEINALLSVLQEN
jgi:AcrR family transcriptional regulator